MPDCNQCGKPAVQEFNGNPLCVECLSKLSAVFHKQEEIRQREMMILMQQAEAVEAEMFETVGLTPPAKKYDFSHLRPPDSYTFHNIQVSDSIVGSVNSGNVEKINVAMTNISGSGNPEFANALKELTESVLQHKDISEAQRQEIIENLAFISEQAERPGSKRKYGLLRSVLTGMKHTIGVASDLAQLWTKFEPILRHFFGL